MDWSKYEKAYNRIFWAIWIGAIVFMGVTT